MSFNLAAALARAASISEVLADPDEDRNGWRIECWPQKGKIYWQFAKGSGKARRRKYGGTFTELNPERQEKYWQNRRKIPAR